MVWDEDKQRYVDPNNPDEDLEVNLSADGELKKSTAGDVAPPPMMGMPKMSTNLGSTPSSNTGSVGMNPNVNPGLNPVVNPGMNPVTNSGMPQNTGNNDTAAPAMLPPGGGNQFRGGPGRKYGPGRRKGGAGNFGASAPGGPSGPGGPGGPSGPIPTPANNAPPGGPGGFFNPSGGGNESVSQPTL